MSSEARPESSESDSRGGVTPATAESLRPRVLPWLVLACTLLSTFAVAYYVWSKDRLASNSAAREAAQHARDRVESRVADYITLLRGAAGTAANRMAEGADKVPRYQGEFANYVASLGLEQNYPGVRGIGFALRLRPDERGDFEREMQKAGTKDFRVWTDVPGKSVDDGDVFPIVYAAPATDRSRSALGFDIFSEPNRHAAMSRARDLGEAAATGMITLKHRTDDVTLNGVVIYLPIYHSGQAPPDVAGRKTELGGYVYAGFRVDELLDGLFNGNAPINFSVFDGDTLLDRTDPEAVAIAADLDTAPADAVRKIDVAGRHWTLRFRPHPRPDLSFRTVVVPGILVTGSVLAFLLFLVTNSEGRARLRAEEAAADSRRAREATEHAMAAVRASEDQLQLITDSLPVLVSYVDARQRYRFANKHYDQWFGVPGEKMKGQTVREVLGEEIYAQREPFLATTLRGEVVRFFGPTPHFEGTPRETQITYVPDFAPDGTVRGFVSLIADVSEQRRTEQALRRYADLFEHAELGLVVTGADGTTFEMVNPAFAKLCGYAKPSELIGRPVYDVFAPEYRTEVPSHVRIARERGHHTFESTFQRPDSSRFPVELDVTAVKGADGSVVYHILSASDITERERTEAELRFQLHLTNTITANAADSLFLMDAHGRVTFLNPAAEARFGWSQDEVAGRALQEILRPDSARDESSDGGELADVFRSGQTLRGHEDVFMCKDGSPVNVLCTSAPILTGDLITGAVLVVHDITDRKRAERERERLLAAEQAARAEAETLARRAAEANRSKDEFLATLSHELRTPLNAVLGWAQLLRLGGLSTEEFGQGLETIERNARVQAELVEDLLDLSRIISGKLRLDVGPVDLPTVIAAALDSARPAAEAKGIRIIPVIDAHAGAISGDANRLQQVVWNLLSNAIKFTPRDGQVQIVLAAAPDGQAEVSVNDSGEGIEPEFLPHVFDRLRQGDASITRKHGGLGLGLSIVRHLVELHGGTVHASSPGKGRGATFTVLLPVVAPRPEPDQPSQAERVAASRMATTPQPLPSLDNVKVLVVDDEPDARELISRILRQCGAEVAVAGSVREAMSMLPSLRPDVLLSDIGMPDEDGYSLIRQVRALSEEEGGRTPAAALTAFARVEDRERALSEGFQLHVAKPVDPGDLARAVAGLASMPVQNPREPDVVGSPRSE